MKRLRKTRKAAAAYIASLLSPSGLKIFRLRNGLFWVGNEFEWLNRY